MKIPTHLLPVLLGLTSVPLKSADSTVDECHEVEDGVCYQSCTGGDCDMECLNSEDYDSCYQGCTGEFSTSAFWEYELCVCFFCQNVGMAMVKSQDVRHTPPRNSGSLHGIKK